VILKTIGLSIVIAFGLHSPAQMIPLSPATSRPPDIPFVEPDADFPLRVHLFSARFGQDSVHLYRTLRGEMNGGPGYYQSTASYHGFGTGNLLGDPTRGFDFDFDCGSSFVENRQPQEFYEARWKRQDESLEILMLPVGSDRADTCELRLTFKAHPFDPAIPPVLPSATLSANAFWHPPDVAFAGAAPDYPVRLHILTGVRRDFQSAVQGYGTANLEGDRPQGADYNYECSVGFLPNSQRDDVYLGHWVKLYQRMEILLQRVGSDKIDRCQINLTLKPLPYPETPAAPSSLPASTAPAMSTR
jgi:hypothetical protein